MYDHRTSPCVLQCRRVSPVVQETYFVGFRCCSGATPASSRSTFGAVPRAVSVTVARQCDPLRVKNAGRQLMSESFFQYGSRSLRMALGLQWHPEFFRASAYSCSRARINQYVNKHLT